MMTSIVNKLEASLIDYASVIIYDCHIFIVEATVLHDFEMFSEFQSEVIVIFCPFHNIYFQRRKAELFFPRIL